MLLTNIFGNSTCIAFSTFKNDMVYNFFIDNQFFTEGKIQNAKVFFQKEPLKIENKITRYWPHHYHTLLS